MNDEHLEITESASKAAPHHSVELQIEELVLHGFEMVDRYRIGDAIERELLRLLTERGVPPSLAHSDKAAMLNVGEFHVLQNESPELIGAKVARAIYGGLST